MFKSFSLLTLALITLSCGEISPQGTENQDAIFCEESCEKDTLWEIKYEVSDLPPNCLKLKLYGKEYLDESNGSESFPFSVTTRTSTQLVISSELFYSPPKSYVDVELMDCTGTKDLTFYKKSNLKYNSFLKELTIVL